MKVFSDTPIVDVPLQKQTILPHGKDFPNKPQRPSLYFNDNLNNLYLALDQWYMVPFGSIDQVNAFKSATSCRIFKGSQLPCDLGGTYLVDTGLAENKRIKLPTPGVAVGLTYHIKNIGKKSFFLETGVAEIMIDNYDELVVHQYQVVTLQFFENNWNILNIYSPASI